MEKPVQESMIFFNRALEHSGEFAADEAAQRQNMRKVLQVMCGGLVALSAELKELKDELAKRK